MTQPYQLDRLPTLSRSTVDRQENLRGDPDRLRARWANARVVLLDAKSGRTPVPRDGDALATRKALSFGDAPPEEAVFLGEWQDVDYWTVPGKPPENGEWVTLTGSWGLRDQAPLADGEVWVDLRGHGDLLDDTSAGLFTTAMALRNWHHRAVFCARCGGKPRLVQFGWATRCPDCGREEYPRTDPAVICLVHDDVGVNGEHVLLARQPIWPPGRYSVLAGFVEAGESLEGCVEREIREEVGAEVWAIRYLGSQPWPFPRSIMLGFTARADASKPLVPQDGEIEAARWVSRAEVLEAFELGREGRPDPEDPGFDPERLIMPGNSSIARVMLEAWANAPVS
ncbi:NAD(+) diphosphatase [Amycolatopsis sp. 195334CR]|uniref:NAD(+) diphosphatase n=1 Tax=Amycolatopsis sp. 195334CR TaxID=2814588 RepID=UPI001A8C8C47|nr:NAD(+) diphosphatase [Amycolatopsis sp. 195334CR]MBN6036779.1 NAD(+) diphosphatase [Amycolatopsis sp. 195334CR]